MKTASPPPLPLLPSLSLLLSVCPSLCLSAPLFLSLSLYLSLPPSLSLSVLSLVCARSLPPMKAPLFRFELIICLMSASMSGKTRTQLTRRLRQQSLFNKHTLSTIQHCCNTCFHHSHDNGILPSLPSASSVFYLPFTV